MPNLPHPTWWPPDYRTAEKDFCKNEEEAFWQGKDDAHHIALLIKRLQFARIKLYEQEQAIHRWQIACVLVSGSAICLFLMLLASLAARLE